MQREVGESAAAPTDEETFYQYLKEMHNRELAFYIEAQRALQKWKADHQGCDPLDPKLLQLHREVNDASQRLKNAYEQLKDANVCPVTKKARLEDLEDVSKLAKALRQIIDDFDSSAIFDINTVVKVPFPSLITPPNRFQVMDERFEYQARSDLEILHGKVVKFWEAGTPIDVKVAGTIGYGKSHMLAVLVLMLFKTPPKNKFPYPLLICYIPDCRALLDGDAKFLTIMQQNILLNFPNFTMPISTIEEIREVMKGHRVILVADQWNSIDDDNDACKKARECLDKCIGTSVRVTIHGLSMNAKTWRQLLPKQYSGDRNTYYGGFQDNEFEVWLRRQPKIFTEHKEELALLTGKVPLLLSAFERAYNLDSSVSWEQVLLRVQKDTLWRDWKRILTEFYSNVEREKVWKVLTRSADWYADDSIIDHRFFYEDTNEEIVATSEIIFRILYHVWSKKGPYDTILSRWPELLDALPNQSARGFYVAQIIKAQICRNGLVGIHPLPKDEMIRRYPFQHGDEKSRLDHAMGKREHDSC